MNRRVTSVLSAAAVFGLAAATLSGTAEAAPQSSSSKTPHPAAHRAQRSDDRPSPLEAQRRAAKQQAAQLVASGKAKAVKKNGSRVVDIGDGDMVEYQTQETQQLLTFLVDFGDTNTNTAFPDQKGPVHGNIPARTGQDNSTYVPTDVSPEHYKDMFFNGMPEQNGESFKSLYKEMSSGRFDLEGDVSDWVKVDKSEASYQDAKGEDTGMDDFLQDSGNAWYDAQKAAGKSDEEIAAYLDRFDQWDRYDIDGDGDFNEPDGYIDHFQAIHAGTGEEDGSPVWTIWSHRSSANYNGYGEDGPAPTQCDACFPIGGVQIGNTGKWIFDYTTEPENGGLGVFAHEFGHDLGLPDFYDTATDTAPDDNGVDYWSLMSAGSWLSHGAGGPGAGTTPDHMDAFSKFYLGWLDYQTVAPFGSETIKLGPSFHATREDGRVMPQAALVRLPDGEEFIPTGSGYNGSSGYLYSGNGDDWRTSIIKSPAFTVPANGHLTAKVAFNDEADWDYNYVEISTDGGKTWSKLHTNLSTSTDPNEQNEGEGITGYSDPSIDPEDLPAGFDPSAPPTYWTDLTADLSAQAGKTAQIRFKHVNDAGYHEFGLKVDNVAVGSALSTDFEHGFAGWEQDSKDPKYSGEFFTISKGGYDVPYTHFYLAENRVYGGYDKTLAEGPYHRPLEKTADNKLDWFKFQDGLLVWYVNTLYSDNNTSQHPGGGLALPVDAHPQVQKWSNGAPTRSRLQTYDSTFGLQATDPLDLSRELAAGTVTLKLPSQPGVAAFDDSVPGAYYSAEKPDASTKVAGSGTSITVLSEDVAAGKVTIKVAPVAPRATAAPTISGTPRVGSKLTANPGTWTLSPALSYQWLADGAPIAGATGSSYTLKPAQSGKSISVRVTASTAAHPTGSATSAGTAKVLPAAVALSVKAPKSVKKGKKATVTVTVSSAGLVPTGTVRVTLGGKTVTKALSGGHVTVKVPATKKGKKKLSVAYTPSTGFTGATKTLTIKVK